MSLPSIFKEKERSTTTLDLGRRHSRRFSLALARKRSIVKNDSFEPMSITIKTARNLKGFKGENLYSMVRVEFGTKFLGESLKINCSKDRPADYNFTVTTNVNMAFADHLLDSHAIPSVKPFVHDLTATPLVITVLEVAHKENKHKPKEKEEHITILGQCCVDLIPFVKGARQLTETVTIIPVPGSPLESLPSEAPKPELDIRLVVSEPLLRENELNDGNFMTITVGSMYSPPDTWNATSDSSYIYGVVMPVPVYTDKEMPVIMSKGKIKPTNDKDQQKKWANPGTAHENAAYIPDKYIFSDSIEEEDGDFKDLGDRQHRYIAETKPKVTWNSERRCYIESSAVNLFKEAIIKTRYLPVEVLRLPVSTSVKSHHGKNKEAETGISFHGITFINLTPLLYPGNKRIKGAFKIIPYTEKVLNERTDRKTGVSEQAVKYIYHDQLPTTLMLERLARSIFKKLSADIKVSEETDTTIVEESVSNSDAQQYLDAKSYIMVEICMDKPLVPKRSCEFLMKEISELIPPKSVFPKRQVGALAIADYHKEVANATNLILDEFGALFLTDIREDKLEKNADTEARRRKLIDELNSSGKYDDIQNKLRNSVMKVVREKYVRTTKFDNEQELQNFISELYVYLIDQMHVSLGKVLTHDEEAAVPQTITDNEQLKYFAREAEVSRNFDLAATYYKMRIARDETDPDVWFDYGTFSLSINDISKAEECFKKCIAIDQKHLFGLLLIGVVSSLTKKHKQAEIFFEAATCLEPNSVLTWTMQGLYYETVKNKANQIIAEISYIKAKKLQENMQLSRDKEERKDNFVEKEEEKICFDEDVNTEDTMRYRRQQVSEIQAVSKQSISMHVINSRAKNRKKSMSPRKIQPGKKSLRRSKIGSLFTPLIESPKEIPYREPSLVPISSIFMDTFVWLLEVKAISFAEKALANEFKTFCGIPTSEYQIALSRLMLYKEEYQVAEKNLNEALKLEFENPDAWSLMGHTKYMMGNTSEARDCYERTLSFSTDASDMNLVYLRLASIYLKEERYQDAKTIFLTACKNSPSCVSWLGLGIACYRLNQLSEAEDALGEANIRNNNNPEVWAYLSLVCLKTKRKFEAEQAYKFAIKLNLEEGPLLAEIKKEQLTIGFGNPTF